MYDPQDSSASSIVNENDMDEGLSDEFVNDAWLIDDDSDIGARIVTSVGFAAKNASELKGTSKFKNKNTDFETNEDGEADRNLHLKRTSEEIKTVDSSDDEREHKRAAADASFDSYVYDYSF